MSHLLCVGLQLLSPLHTPGTTCFSCLHHVVGSAPPSAAPSANLSCEHPPHSACPPWDPTACQRPFPMPLLGPGCWCQATSACPPRLVQSCLISPPTLWIQVALLEPPRQMCWSPPLSSVGVTAMQAPGALPRGFQCRINSKVGPLAMQVGSKHLQSE